MATNVAEIMNQLKEEFPEIFIGDDISIVQLSFQLEVLEKYDKDTPVRYVLIEKEGNIVGKKIRLLKLFNKLSPII